MDFRTALIAENHAFGRVVARADPMQPVRTCPGWTVQQLFRHVGRGDRWSAQIVGDRLEHPPNPREVRDGKPPADDAGALDWLHGGAAELLAAVDRVGEDSPAWTFIGPKPARWWVRRRLHETLVHRADAHLALGEKFEAPGELAADAVTEWIELVTALHPQGPLPTGAILHLHATDDGLGAAGEWSIAATDSGLTWSHDHRRGDAAVRGPATELLLALTRRRPADELDLQVIGDRGVWDGWLAGTPL